MHLDFLPACTCVCLLPKGASRGWWISWNWSYWQLLAATWVLGIKLEPYKGAATALNRVIFPAHKKISASLSRKRICEIPSFYFVNYVWKHKVEKNSLGLAIHMNPLWQHKPYTISTGIQNLQQGGHGDTQLQSQHWGHRGRHLWDGG